MVEPGEFSHRLFGQNDLARLSRHGEQVVRASNTVERAPFLVQEKTARWDKTRLDLKAAVLDNGDLTTAQKAAALAALDRSEPGIKDTELNELANDLAARYETADMALSNPGVLVMTHQVGDNDDLFKTSGTGLRLGVGDRDEGYIYGLYTGTIDETGEERSMLLDTESMQNIVLDPEEASQLRDLSFDEGLWTHRLIVGAETVAAVLAGDKFGGFKGWKWRQARSLGFRFEELDPRLKEQYDSERQKGIKNLAQELYSASDLRPYQLKRLREKFEDIKFFGTTGPDIEAEVLKLLAEKQERALGLLEFVISVEVEESATTTAPS